MRSKQNETGFGSIGLIGWIIDNINNIKIVFNCRTHSNANRSIEFGWFSVRFD